MKVDSTSLLDREVWGICNVRRDGDRLLQLLIFNEEFLVSASHQLALITSLPFVHTARRSYRLNDPVSCSDREGVHSLDSLVGSFANHII